MYDQNKDKSIGVNETMESTKYTKEELAKWWIGRCPLCNWKGLSRDASGGEAIADTGDYNDVVCPECIKVNKRISLI